MKNGHKGPKPVKSFRNKYLALMIVVMALFQTGYSQDSAKYSNIPGYGFRYKRHIQDSLAVMPLSTSPHNPYRAGGYRFDSTNRKLQFWYAGGWNDYGKAVQLTDSTFKVGVDTILIRGTGTGGGGSGSVTSISQGFGIIHTPNPIVSTGIIAADTSSSGLSGYYLRRKDSILYTTVTRLADTSAALRAIIGSGGTVNLDTSRNSTSATIIPPSGTSAVLKLVDPGSNKAGLMSPLDKLVLDSMYNGLLSDSTVQYNIGRGKPIAFVRGDSLQNKTFYDTTYISWHTFNDSTFYGLLDTAGLRSTIGASANPGGSNTQLQYNNSSAFGGTAGATWDATNTGITISKSSLGVTQNIATGFRLVNPTAAAAGSQQISPMLYFEGQGWKTTATAASQSTAYTVDVLPVQGSTAPDASLRVRQIINGGTAQTVGEFYPAGMHIGGNNGGGINFVGAPSVGNINSLNGLSFTSNSAPQQIAYSFVGNAGWAQTSSKSSLLNLSPGTNGFFPTSGVATYAHLWVQAKINQTSTAAGITNAVLVEANVVSATDFRAHELSGFNTGYGYRSDSASVKHRLAGETYIGGITDRGAYKLQDSGGAYIIGNVYLDGTLSGSSTDIVLVKRADSLIGQVPSGTFRTSTQVATQIHDSLVANSYTAGEYTATLSNATNTDGQTFNRAFYTRIGNIVTVTMYITVDPTATGAVLLNITLPFASTLSSGSDVMGVGNCTSVPAQTVTLAADTINNKANFGFIATDTNAQAFYIVFTYIVH